MRIAVCLKQVLDPEIPPRLFQLDADARHPQTGPQVALVPDSFAENALEVGLQLRDSQPGSILTVHAVASSAADEVLRRAFALTADSAVRAWDDSWSDLDGLAIAHILAASIREAGGADVILCGHQASDIEESVVGPALAEELRAPCVTFVRAVRTIDEHLEMIRGTGDGTQTVRVRPPVVVTASSASSNQPRMATAKDSMLSRRKPIHVQSSRDLALNPARVEPGTWLERLVLPASAGYCEMLAGADPEELAAALVTRLRAAKLFA